LRHGEQLDHAPLFLLPDSRGRRMWRVMAGASLVCSGALRVEVGVDAGGKSHRGVFMVTVFKQSTSKKCITVVRNYDVAADAKNRISLRGAKTKYFHVMALSNGSFVLEPTAPNRNTKAPQPDLARVGKSPQRPRRLELLHLPAPGNAPAFRLRGNRERGAAGVHSLHGCLAEAVETPD
jgi:hypothetical protein